MYAGIVHGLHTKVHGVGSSECRFLYCVTRREMGQTQSSKYLSKHICHWRFLLPFTDVSSGFTDPLVLNIGTAALTFRSWLPGKDSNLPTVMYTVQNGNIAVASKLSLYRSLFSLISQLDIAWTQAQLYIFVNFMVFELAFFSRAVSLSAVWQERALFSCLLFSSYSQMNDFPSFSPRQFECSFYFNIPRLLH